MNILECGHIYSLEAAPVPSCHASTIERMANGKLAAAWFGGAFESDPGVCIWFSVKEPEGWRAPVRVTPDNHIAHWNPVLFADRDSGVLWLFYKEGISPREWETMVIRSADCGESWSQPEVLVPGATLPKGPVKNKPIRLSDGSWLAPSSLETVAENWMLLLDRSEDGGKTWQDTGLLPMEVPGYEGLITAPEQLPEKAGGLIQPTLWEEPRKPGHVHLLARSSFGRIYRADSEDYGKSWSPAVPTDLPNNNSGLDLACTADGTLALVCNPLGENWGKRTPLSLLLSRDNGETWEKALDLETEEGEFSYPAVIAEGNVLFIVYTWNRKLIHYVSVQID